MPELPEVEVVRRDLEREVVGKKIKAVDVDGMRAVRRHHNRKQFTSRLGRPQDHRRSNGGASTCSCSSTATTCSSIHLGMSGQLLRAKSSREPTAKHTHVVITFTQGGQLRFVDPRTFGEMFVTESDTVEKQVTELAHLGHRPARDARCRGSTSATMLAQRHAKLKPLLMDQKFIAGIGNIYSDEILWGAGLRWDRMSDALTSEEVRRLYRSMMETLQEAVKHRGSSLADEQYVDLFGRPGEYQHFHNVYAREGLACPRCRHVIVRERVSGRSTFYLLGLSGLSAVPRRARTMPNGVRVPRPTGGRSLRSAETATSRPRIPRRPRSRSRPRVPQVADAPRLQVVRRQDRPRVRTGRDGGGRARTARGSRTSSTRSRGCSARRARARCAAARWTTSSSPARPTGPRSAGPRCRSRIDNTAGLLPIEFSEVTITRTLFRAGDSEYQINGAPCRLLDIQELLSDTGIGRQQHVIVGQGQLDAVLNARPEDRRAIVEEAAGILKFRKRRERAERRLEATEGNLLRLNDLLREVRRQLTPLQRQADAARRHGGLVEELRAIRLHLAGHEIAGLQARRRAPPRPGRRARATARRPVRGRLRDLDVAVLDAEHALTAAGHGDLADALTRVESLAGAGRRLRARCSTRRRAACERELAAVADEGVFETLVADAAEVRRQLDELEAASATLAEERAAVERAEYDLAAAHRAFAESRDARTPTPMTCAWLAASSRPDARRWPASTPSSTRVAGAPRAARARALDALAAEHHELERDARAHRRRAAGSRAGDRGGPRGRRPRDDRRAPTPRPPCAPPRPTPARWQARAEALAAALDRRATATPPRSLAGLPGVVGPLVDHLEIDAGAEARGDRAARRRAAARSWSTARRRPGRRWPASPTATPARWCWSPTPTPVAAADGTRGAGRPSARRLRPQLGARAVATAVAAHARRRAARRRRLVGGARPRAPRAVADRGDPRR